MIHEDTLLLDGDCGLCNRVAIILHPRLDNDKNLRFLTNESEEGKKIIDELSTKKQKADTVYLIRNGESFIRSAAAIRCLLYLKWTIKKRNFHLLLCSITPMKLSDVAVVNLSR